MVVKKEVSIAGVFFFIRDAHTVCVKERERNVKRVNAEFTSNGCRCRTAVCVHISHTHTERITV